MSVYQLGRAKAATLALKTTAEVSRVALASLLSVVCIAQQWRTKIE